MLKTHGMLHFSLAVTDLERSRKFYEEVLGLRVLEQSPRMVFLQTGDDYLILAKGTEPLKYDSAKNTPVHHAFKVKPDECQWSIDDLRKNGVEVFNYTAHDAGGNTAGAAHPGCVGGRTRQVRRSLPDGRVVACGSGVRSGRAASAGARRQRGPVPSRRSVDRAAHVAPGGPCMDA